MNSKKRRKLTDKTARWVITLGGMVTVIVILALFFFIFLEVYPLLQGAKVTKENIYTLQDKAISLGVDDHQEVAYAIYGDGMIEFLSLLNGEVLKKHQLTGLVSSIATHQETTNPPPHFPVSQGGGGNFPEKGVFPEQDYRNYLTSASKDHNRLILGTNDGRVLTVSIEFPESFDKGKRTVSPEITEEEPVLAVKEKAGIISAVSRRDEDATVTVALGADGSLLLIATEVKQSLFGEGDRNEIRKDMSGLVIRQVNRQSSLSSYREKFASSLFSPLSGAGGKFWSGTLPVLYDLVALRGTAQVEEIGITALALDLFMENLYVGTSSGEIFHINVRERNDPCLIEKVRVSDKAITSLGFLMGDVSLVVGDAGGGVNVWMQVRDEGSASGWALKKVHTLAAHRAPVMGIVASQRDKGFVTSAADGTIHLNHATSEQTRLKLAADAQWSALSFSPKANGILIADRKGRLFHWHIANPHPETTLKTLFGKVWYEGYEKPEYIWQSTGGTDDFEPKLSLTPLIFGTIKGTVYALIIAVPIGIFAALYTSQFLHNSLKIIKPVIEIMAALPSVILGFLAGLWLAPLMERIFPAIIIMPFFITLSIATAIFCWKILPVFGKGWYRHGTEALFLIPFIIGAVYLSIRLGGGYESLFLDGDYREWLSDILGLHYDQRNAVVVGIAMGFAVIPLIFTISEDAMSNVPNSLRSASLALGATPWQTAVRVVLPTASPGIFSAVMIGFGRAVGETMIVLMATGNTPIMEWNIFNGFRALSANIAVEIPEAPHGGTLYRVLFLAALLLFVTTFVVNTVAETVRQRMKLRYSKL